MLKRILLFSFIFLITANIYAGEPTIGATNMTFSKIFCDKIRVNWVSGNGKNRIVVCREGSAVNSHPEDGTTYVSDNRFGDGDELGTGNFVVYNSIGKYVGLIGLKKNTTYHFAVYEHDGQVNPDYLKSSVLKGNFKTENLDLNFTFRYDNEDSCQNTNNIIFTNNTTASFSGLTYTWTFGDNSTSSSKDPSHSYDLFGNRRIKLKVFPSKGCVDNIEKEIIIHPRTTPTFNFNDSDQCLKGNVFKTIFDGVKSLPKISGYSYIFKWDFGDGHKTTAINNRYNYSKSGIYNVKFKIQTVKQKTLTKPRYGTSCFDSTYKIAIVRPDPSGDLVVNDSVQCEGNQNFVFENKSVGAIGFKWYFGDGDSANTKIAAHKYKDTGKYMIIHKAISVYGCNTTDTMFVKVISGESTNFSGLPNHFCHNDAAVILFPDTKGGSFIGKNMTDSLFTPKDTGHFTIRYTLPLSACKDTTDHMVYVEPLPNVYLGNDTTICDNSSFLIGPTGPKSAGIYEWSTGESTTQKSVKKEGTYTLKITGNKCSNIDSKEVYYATPPQVELGKDSAICSGALISLSAGWPKSKTIWQDGNTDTLRRINIENKYIVTISNKCGTVKDSINIFVLEGFCDIFVPNAFSPNGDNINAIFKPIGNDGIIFTNLKIFNKWGEQIHDSPKDKIEWDGNYQGTFIQEGIYIWQITYRSEYGAGFVEKTIQGTVVVLK